ncbi:MAG: 2-amino-4-hydroxy-6-hydroxymethyldihydropteridine diphosphokinase [Bacteroidales bacterium]|nr:2-amino-4-hydroxy-6-hydroxymethyldihydropteridine diphosphokinase [Bacteroidales bacterium]MCM1147680.1 2-amino-4-hydroxy-6-hydroxymethyldihydropteridine diphosphokinase [Bacteroidales bacterium]MCM1206792.1 2-amino-4-hydroxy-6-hydroxymethyldihydropteridine diphosphokinase [Bacillota bacterium]MCM1510691.1 2-amino-4-hydroxy-6-hydroxymethyldihydropteridine diphosphokinase [Clostridium sp.]
MKVVISLGSNKNRTENIGIAEKELSGFFSAIRFSCTRYTGGGYCNAVGVGDTSLPYATLRENFKRLEQRLGRTEDRKCIPIDIDILEYGGHCHKPEDIARGYNVELMKELGL